MSVAEKYCGACSRQANVCRREPGHHGGHEMLLNGKLQRWYGDTRWAPWEWILYEWDLIQAMTEDSPTLVDVHKADTLVR